MSLRCSETRHAARKENASRRLGTAQVLEVACGNNGTLVLCGYFEPRSLFELCAEAALDAGDDAAVDGLPTDLAARVRASDGDVPALLLALYNEAKRSLRDVDAAAELGRDLLAAVDVGPGTSRS